MVFKVIKNQIDNYNIVFDIYLTGKHKNFIFKIVFLFLLLFLIFIKKIIIHDYEINKTIILVVLSFKQNINLMALVVIKIFNNI